MSGESWPLYGSNLEEVESELKDKLILDGNEIHPLKTSHFNRFGPSGLFHWTKGILALHGAITHTRFIIYLRRICALTDWRKQWPFHLLILNSPQSSKRQQKCEIGVLQNMYLFSLGFLFNSLLCVTRLLLLMR